jgi:hypothetical protein
MHKYRELGLDGFALGASIAFLAFVGYVVTSFFSLPVGALLSRDSLIESPDDIDSVNIHVSADPDSDILAEVRSGDRFKMICWEQGPDERMWFYGRPSSAPSSGFVRSTFVVLQFRVSRC